MKITAKIYKKTTALALACAGAVFFSAIAFATDTDSDGLDDSVDNFPSVPIFAPQISSPSDKQIFKSSTEPISVPFSGIAEIGSAVRIFESTSELCTATVSGDGFLLDGSFGGANLVSGTVVDQHFFRSSSGSGFPTATILVADSDGKISVFDASDNQLFREISISGDIRAVFGFKSKIYVATSAGIQVFDATGGKTSEFTTSTTPAIPSNSVTDVVVREISSKIYIVASTASGASVINETANTEISTASTDSLVQIALTDENNLVFATASKTFRTSATIDALADNFASTEILGANFSGGTTAVLENNLVGTSAGLSQISSDGEFVRNISKNFATLPMHASTVGHWADSATDRSGNGNDLTNTGSAVVAAVAAGAELQKFSFDGATQYLGSNSANFNISGDKITVGAWIRRPQSAPSNLTDPFQKVLAHGESESSRNYWIGAGDNFLDYPMDFDPYSFGVQTSAGFRGVFVEYRDPTTNLPPVNEWEFIVGVYDGTKIEIFRNGISEASVPHTGNLTNLSESFRIGYGYGDEFFKGSVALPFVSAHAMTPEQVAAVYDLSKNWFAPNSKITLAGNSNSVSDISCSPDRGECFVATADGITKFNTLTGLTSNSLSGISVSKIDQTNYGQFTCSASVNFGTHSAFARAYLGVNPSSVDSDSITFHALSPSGDTDGDGLDNSVDNDPITPIATPVIAMPADGDAIAIDSVNFSGTADPNTNIVVFNGTQSPPSPFCSATVDAVGSWSCTASNLIDGNHLAYAVAYIGENSSSVTSDNVGFQIDTAPPISPPTINPLPDFTGSTTVSISWTALTDAFQYRGIEVADTENFDQVITDSGWVFSTSHNFDNLENGKTYFFRVKARDAAGNETEYSPVVSTTIDVESPVVGTISADSGSFSSTENISFSWQNFTDALSGIDHFHLQISDEASFDSPLVDDSQFVGTSTAVVGTSGNSYFARVRAIDAVGNQSDWVQSPATTIDTTPPTDFTLNPNPSPSANISQTISWTTATDPESGISEYAVFREVRELIIGGEIVKTPMEQIATTTNLSFTDQNLLDGHKYLYQISAKNSVELTTDSNQIEIVIDATAPTPPSWKNIQNYSTSGEIALEWTPAVDQNGISKYKIFRDGSEIAEVGSTTFSWTDTSSKPDANSFEYKIRAVDSSGNSGSISDSPILRVLVDKTPPATSLLVDGEVGENEWRTSPITLELSASDPGQTLFDSSLSTGSGFFAGVDKTFFNRDSLGITPYSSPIIFDADGTHSIEFFSSDRAGNSESTQTAIFKIDTTPPIASFSPQNIDPTENNGFTRENSISFVPAGSDDGSGIASVRTFVRFDQNGDGLLAGANDFDFTEISTANGDVQNYTFPHDGEFQFKTVATDLAGLSTTSAITTIKRDTTPPITIDSVPEGVQTSAFTIKLLPTDATVSSGLDKTFYTTDGSDPATSATRIEGIAANSNQIFVDQDSYFVIRYYSTDLIGNVEAVKSGSNKAILDLDNDADNDGMSNDFEVAHGLDPTDPSDAELDPDLDTLTNLREFQLQTDPNSRDTDSDTIDDNDEISDGTSPTDSGDHRVILTAPADSLATSSPFTLLVRAPAGKTVRFRTSSGAIFASGVADSNGILAVEVFSLPTGNSTISAEFTHDSGSKITTPNIQIAVGDPSDSPKFTNIVDGQNVDSGFTSAKISAPVGDTVELFKISDGEISSLGSAVADSSGIASIPVPSTSLKFSLFALDQTKKLTTEIVGFQRELTATGQVLDESGTPLEKAPVQFWSENNTKLNFAITDANGNYSLRLAMHTNYSVKIWTSRHYMFAQGITVGESDPRISPRLKPITDQTLVQTEHGIKQIKSEEIPAGAFPLRWAGMARGESMEVNLAGVSKKEFATAYKKSMEEVAKSNAGVAGEVLTTKNRWGQEIFLGYKSGRIASDKFRISDQYIRFSGISRDEKIASAGRNETGFRSSAPKCTPIRYTIANFSDVPTRHPYHDDLRRINAFGILTADRQNKIRPDEMIDWETLLRISLAGKCIEIESLAELKKSVKKIEKVKFNNSEFSRLVYTALRHDLIDADFDPSEKITRERALQILFRVFPTPINENARSSSFVDVLPDSELAPALVAAKRAGWFKNFRVKTFRPNSEITRAEFASWFTNAIGGENIREAQTKNWKKTLDFLRGKSNELKKSARAGGRSLTQISDAQRHLNGRYYHKNVKKAKYYGPTRSAFLPDKTKPRSGRAPMQIFDRSDRIRGGKLKKIIRDRGPSPANLIRDRREKSAKSRGAGRAKLRGLPTGKAKSYQQSRGKSRNGS